MLDKLCRGGSGKNLQNFKGGSGPIVNLLGAKGETFGHPKTGVYTVDVSILSVQPCTFN